MVQEVESPPEGRETDVRIARLLGWTWNEQSARHPLGGYYSRMRDDHGRGPEDPWAWLEPYSSSIEAAWEVVEWAHAQGAMIYLVWCRDTQGEPGSWQVQVGRTNPELEAQFFDPSAPLAICGAVLKVFL